MLSRQSCVIRNESIPWRLIENEAILVDVKKGEVIHANEVAACIWGLLEQKRNLGDIVGEVCRTFEIDEHSAEADALEFIQALQAKGLVNVADA